MLVQPFLVQSTLSPTPGGVAILESKGRESEPSLFQGLEVEDCPPPHLLVELDTVELPQRTCPDHLQMHFHILAWRVQWYVTEYSNPLVSFPPRPMTYTVSVLGHIGNQP